MAGPIFSCLYHRFINGPRKWYPIISVFYLANRCRFRCPYCSDGSGKPYYELDGRILPPKTVISLLGKIRRQCAHVVITGGEPLEYPDFPEVMAGVRELGFKGVILTTNGHQLGRMLPVLASPVTTLVVSLDTLDGKRADATYGVGGGAHRQVLENIELARRYKGRKFEVSISSVVTPGGLEDLYGVYEYARERGFSFAACPQLVGVKAHGDLVGNPRYRDFYDFLIREKRRGGRIFGTIKYLEYMRDLRKFQCRPFTMLVVSPLGEVFYPCLERGNYAGNLLAEDDLHKIREEGEKRFGPQPECDNRCHSACALGFGLGLAHPVDYVSEAGLAVKSAFQRVFMPSNGSHQ